MTYYPLLCGDKMGLEGWATLCHFSPNPAESKERGIPYVHLSWADSGQWHHRKLGTMMPAEVRQYTYSDVKHQVPEGELALLSLSFDALPLQSSELPKLNFLHTSHPQWRASIGLKSKFTSTQYQGDIMPFPERASLLSFSPFLQLHPEIDNFLVLINIESEPTQRSGLLTVLDAQSKEKKETYTVCSNSANIISLNQKDVCEDSLQAMLCPEMAGVPIYVSATRDRSQLSMEHSHPPNCAVVLGERYKAQAQLKQHWFSFLN